VEAAKKDLQERLARLQPSTTQSCTAPAIHKLPSASGLRQPGSAPQKDFVSSAGAGVAKDNASSDIGDHVGKVAYRTNYDNYVATQTAVNKAKLHMTSMPELEIAFLAQFVKETSAKAPYQFGICHGSRRGNEQLWFAKHLCWPQGTVIGTEISETATRFPNTIQWDFHKVKDEWLNSAAFVYSNALDHSYDPRIAITQWMRCVNVDWGVLLLEHNDFHTPTFMAKANDKGVEVNSSGKDFRALNADIFGASFTEYLRLILSLQGTQAGGRFEIADIFRHPTSERNDRLTVRYIAITHQKSHLHAGIKGRLMKKYWRDHAT